ncbi:imelysin family protein [Coralliovum pocilloporae]|uniref:imelysin family protein n=1 Tax=Coralliovum pocilloporae TaxID=3066369 RepID=UPI003307217B
MMRSFLNACLVASGLVLSSAFIVIQPYRADAAEGRFAGVADRVLDGYLRPGYRALEEDAGRMADDVAAFCAASETIAPQALKDRFARLARSWSRLEFVRFGPVIAGHRYERLFFWPDVKGRGLRQVRRLMKARDAVVDDPAAYRKKSVALQGLQALEYVLFDGKAVFGPDEAGQYRCRLAMRIAAGIHDTASSLRADWDSDDGYARLMNNPGPDNPVYRSEKEVAQELITVLVSGLEAIRDRKVLVALGRDGATPKPKRLPFRRSGLAIEALAANLDGLAELYRAAGFDRDLKQNDQWLQQGIPFEFRNADRALSSLQMSIENAVADKDAAERLRYVSVVVDTLGEAIGVDLSTAIDLKAGFNALDGD